MMVVLTTNNDEETGRGFLASATAGTGHKMRRLHAGRFIMQ